MSLDPRPPHLLTASHVPRRAGHDDAALDEAGELIDLHRIVTAVCHGDDADVGSPLCDTEAQCVCRAAPKGIEHRPQALLSLRVGCKVWNGRVAVCVIHDQHFRGQRDRLEDAVEKGDDRGTLVVCGDDHADAWLHTLTPLPSRLVMSTTGFAVCRSPYCRCGAVMMIRSASATTVSRGTRSGSPATNGSLHNTRAALPVRIRFSLELRLCPGSSDSALTALPTTPTVSEPRLNCCPKLPRS